MKAIIVFEDRPNQRVAISMHYMPTDEECALAEAGKEPDTMPDSPAVRVASKNFADIRRRIEIAHAREARTRNMPRTEATGQKA